MQSEIRFTRSSDNYPERGMLYKTGEVARNAYCRDSNQARYTVYVRDRPDIEVPKTYAVQIIAQGRETEWHNKCSEGRREMLQYYGFHRLVTVILKREHTFESISEIVRELGLYIQLCVPVHMPPGGQICILADISGVGHREILCRGTTKLSGPYVVENVLGDNKHILRKLIFLNNELTVQSIARLKTAENRAINGKCGASKANPDGTRVVVDHGFLACEYHPHMCVAAIVPKTLRDSSSSDILVIGLGGGSLCSFLHRCFPELKITVVEIDEEVLPIATKWFDLCLDDRLRVEIADGVEFVARCAKKGRKFDAILVDADHKDKSDFMSFPAKSFIQHQFLESVSDCLNEDGLFVLNTECYCQMVQKKLRADVLNSFASVICFCVENHINDIFVCSKKKITYEDFKDSLDRAMDALNTRAKARKLATDNTIESKVLWRYTQYNNERVLSTPIIVPAFDLANLQQSLCLDD